MKCNDVEILIERHRRIIEKMTNKPCYKQDCILYDGVVCGVGYEMLLAYVNVSCV